MADQPWHELPAEVVSVLRPALDDVAREIIEAVATVPAYARPLEGPFGEGLRIGVQEALRHFLGEIEAGGPVERLDVYQALGRGEMRAGRSLESLLSAYRIGARVAWRRFAELGVRAGLAPDTLYLLAESIFAYIDVLSAESAEGYALEQSAAAGEAQLSRRRLVRMLVREPPSEPEAVQAAAVEATWAIPRSLAVLAVGGERRELVPVRLPSGTISEAIGEVVYAVVADPDGPGRRAVIEHAVVGAGARGGLGTTVEWTQARISFARAQAALELVGATAGFVVARDRAGELLLRSAPGLAGELAADRLAPLAGLSPGARDRLRETLRVWLAEQGRLGSVAHRLGIHPQTARYRIGRLRELFGGALDEPEDRFWLEVALRVPEQAVDGPDRRR
ncbi:MAG TPA: helix-turn-helix domain-containing protein [Solirubrobacteraceae bacterium]|nr:helix-turn-helix domain-containing protein [Solirubrobacteraceae bacterium]